MDQGLNRIQLIGTIEHEPEIRYTPNGSPVANFTLKVEETHTRSGNPPQHRVEWFHIGVWEEELAETVGQLLQSSQQVYIEGRVQTRRWEDSTGALQSRIEVVAEKIILLKDPNKPSTADDSGHNNDSENYAF